MTSGMGCGTPSRSSIGQSYAVQRPVTDARVLPQEIVLKASRLASAIVATALGLGSFAALADVPAPQDVPFNGTLKISVDATDLARRVFRVHEVIPAQAGPLTLLYPQWLPGNHSPTGPIDKLAGLKITANGKTLKWTRDPLNVYAFHVDVPEGASDVEVEFQFLSCRITRP